MTIAATSSTVHRSSPPDGGWPCSNRHAVSARHGLILFGAVGTGKTGGQCYRDLLDCRRSLSQALDPAGVAGIFVWPQIGDQRQRSLVKADAQTTNTSEAVYVLTAVST